MEKRTMFSFLIGAAILAVAGMAATQQQMAVGQAGGGVVSPNATETGNQSSTTRAGNFTVTEKGLGNGTLPSSTSTPVDTTQLKMHIEEARKALDGNNTQAAMTHIVMALEQIKMILGGNTTSTTSANSTSAIGSTTTSMIGK